MATNTPNVGAPVWESQQSSPWVTQAGQARIWDAFAVGTIVEQMDVNSPPGSCADGARYEVGSSPSGDWVGHAGELAIAVGANATNGWEFADIAVEGAVLFDRASGAAYRYLSGVWTIGDGSSSIGQAVDFSGGFIDGYVLRYDGSNGVFYLSPDAGRAPPTINAQTGTSYTLGLGDAENIVELTNGSAITLTVPSSATVNFPIGTAIEIHQGGAGVVTVVGASGPPTANVVSRGSVFGLAGEDAIAVLRKVASDTWRLTGDIA